MKTKRSLLLFWILLAVPAVSRADAIFESELEILRVGQWLEVRGEMLRADVFTASRVELMEPQRYEALVGTVGGRPRGDEFSLLGQPVRVSEKTEWEDVARTELTGARVKVEGHYRDRDKFSAREISPRDVGRERIAGRVDSVRRTAQGYEVRIMRFVVELPGGLKVEHERPWQELPLAPADLERASIGGRDEDDLFGEGVALTRNTRLGAQLEVRSTAEENFDLDDEDREDRIDDEGSARLRLDWEASALVSAQVEGRFQVRYRDDEEDGSSTEDSSRLGESFVYLRDPFKRGIDLVVGRQDFDDRREWIYDQNLDGLRLLGRLGQLNFELSASTSLSDADERNESATNYIAYLSNRDEDRHLAGYVIHRDFDLGAGERTTHVGGRMIGSWWPAQKSWVELAYMTGRLLEGDTRGWGLDVGTTWAPAFAEPFAFTVGYAYGSGDAESDRLGGTYRQTGLQDNNGKFDGVTSFRYYGELLDPELANLHIVTLGWGMRFPSRTSLDLVGHYYRQVEPRPRLVDTELDDRPDGEHAELGWELDAILGWRGRPDLDLEIVGGYFRSGAAFPGVDEALLAKVQLRYRI